ncbi:MAG: hypothetical protein EPO32_12125 [Anaerolineae bacterium]|nr:MAG: hypothetical protein EPO32_12125 [Anaerolineae bacterium]
MTDPRRPIPIYTTAGDYEAFLAYPIVYNLSGEAIGFVTPEREVYSVHGEYVGWLTNDPRILRKRTYDYAKPKQAFPSGFPRKLVAPPSAPLPPMMAELSFDTIDVLDEYPELLPTADAGEFRDDMD